MYVLRVFIGGVLEFHVIRANKVLPRQDPGFSCITLFTARGTGAAKCNLHSLHFLTYTSVNYTKKSYFTVIFRTP